VPLSPRLITDDLVSLSAAVLQGVGVAQLPAKMVGADIAAGSSGPAGVATDGQDSSRRLSVTQGHVAGHPQAARFSLGRVRVRPEIVVPRQR
jgi:DNA-binding transcriptional LysR family regulator